MYAGPVQEVIDQFGRLPGIGPKSAQRIAFHLLKVPTVDAARLAQSIVDMKERMRWCDTCHNLTDEALCGICRDARRDTGVICVVEEPRDVVAVERTHEFHGVYHVLGGTISPLDGVGPDQLNVASLLARLRTGEVREVILCLNPNLEGEVTAGHLVRLIAPLDVAVTRVASGLPVGGDLEYADELTLGRALSGRRSVADW